MSCINQCAIALRTQSEVIDYRQDGSGVTATLSGGERVAGAALTGAEGLWSDISIRLLGDGPPQVLGHTIYRSVIPTEHIARGAALERSHAVGRSKIPHLPLTAAGLEDVQPRRHHP